MAKAKSKIINRKMKSAQRERDKLRFKAQTLTQDNDEGFSLIFKYCSNCKQGGGLC